MNPVLICLVIGVVVLLVIFWQPPSRSFQSTNAWWSSVWAAASDPKALALPC